MRFHELAKELNADSKELLALAKKLGLPVKSHSSNLEPGTVGILKAAWRYRDLSEDEILEKLEQAEATREAEKKAGEEQAKQDSARAAADRQEREAKAKADAEAAAHAVESADGPLEAYASPDDDEEVEEGDEEFVEGEPDGEAVEGEEPLAAEDAPAAAPDAEDEPLAAPAAGTAAPPAAAPQAAPAAHPAGTHAPAAHAPAAHGPAPAGGPAAPRRPGAPLAPAAAGGPGAVAAPGTPGAPAAPVRRGAKILGRIELNKADVAKSEATHAELERTLGPSPSAAARGRKAELDREQELAAQRKRQKLAGGNKPLRWQTETDEFAPVSDAQVAKPKFWERGPSRRQQRTKLKRPPGMLQKNAEGKKFQVELPTSIKGLSALLGLRAAEIMSKLLTVKGTAFGINQPLDEETVLTVAVEFNRDVEILHERTEETEFLKKEKAKAETKAGPKKEGEPRPPVVVVMGHVDHGKTSLLDAIRKTKVAAGEHGGITQHMRAYQVTSPKGGRITFLDTPGHRAFTEMRSRGANVTDIVVLVVAADDGVMPQTVESVEHARAANPDMPIVVALNKIDKGGPNANRVKQQLMGLQLLPEEFGGKVGVVETSATTGKGIHELLERLELEAEVHDLRANPKGRAQGIVLEATKEEGKGVVATILVRQGTLKPRDPFLCGNTWGRVRMLEDDTGKKVDVALPSMPVKVYGFKGDLPSAGDEFIGVEDEKGAEQVAAERSRTTRDGQAYERPKVTLENLFETLGAVKQVEIPLILKADMQGSLEVLKRELEDMKHAEVKIRVLRAAVGAITEEDVMLASTSGAMVVGFHVVPEGKARRLQDQYNVQVKTYYVIYELLDDLKKAMAGTLKPEEKEKVIGHVAIRETFKVSKVGTIAGCFVTDGLIRRSDRVRVLRDGKVIYTTGLDSLRRFKDDVKEVKENFECGIKLAKFDDIKVGDVLEVFEMTQHVRELELT